MVEKEKAAPVKKQPRRLQVVQIALNGNRIPLVERHTMHKCRVWGNEHGVEGRQVAIVELRTEPWIQTVTEVPTIGEAKCEGDPLAVKGA